MSAKKSWDVERSPKRVHQEPVQAPASETRTTTKKVKRKVTKSRRAEEVVHVSRPRHTTVAKEPLKVRRARAKRIFILTTSVLSVLAIACILYLSWLPALRVHTVTAEGPNADAVIELAKESLSGTHAFIVPRDSLFFIPESNIRRNILDTHADVVAVSFKDGGLTGLHIILVPRTSAFLWCGAAKDMPTEQCYNADADGLIFSPHIPTDDQAEPSTLHLRMYAPIDGDTASPLRAHIKETHAIPNALQLARALKSLNAHVAALALRGDEADFYTTGGTRITYVIGRERQAIGLAASAFPKLSLNDGSIEYVDLRFEAKVYVRRVGEATPE